jgi:hypothetical protein
MKRLLVTALSLMCAVPAWAQAPIAAGRTVSGRVIVENGGTPPRFALPVTAPGRPVANITINPAPDGSFRTALPEGSSVVAAATGLPAGATVRSITYGTANLLRETLNVTSTDTAELIVVLSMPRPVSVSGRVTGMRSAQGILVMLAGTQFEALLNPDGSFVIPNVTPGNYQARLINSGASVQVPVMVGATDVTGVTIPIPKERVVTGLILVEDGIRPTGITVDAKSASGQTISSTVPTAYQGTNSGQFVLLKMEDGEYGMSVRNLPAGYSVKSMTYGTTDLLKAPLKLDGLAVWTVTVRVGR